MNHKFIPFSDIRGSKKGKSSRKKKKWLRFIPSLSQECHKMDKKEAVQFYPFNWAERLLKRKVHNYNL